MRRGICALSLTAFFIVPVSAQVKPGDSALTARSVFENLQAPALEILGPSSRLDMLDYWDADSVHNVTNALSGLSNLETVTDDYLRVRVTPVSTLDIKLLPVKGGNLVMTVYTVGGDGQALDSEIDFYDANLNKLDKALYFKTPDLKAFFDIPKGSATSMKEIREMIPFTTVEYSLTPGSNDLKARLTVGEFMNQDEWNIAKIFLRPEVVIPWKGKYK